MSLMDEGKVLVNLRKGVLEPCVLALMRDGERYGVDLAKTLAHSGLIASEGTLYPVLARLRSGGLVTTRWEESPAGPPRRYYRLTPEGERAVRVFTGVWEPFSTSVHAILTGETS